MLHKPVALAHREHAEKELRMAFNELERTLQKLRALNEWGKLVNDANHEETVLEIAVQGAVEFTDARASSVVTIAFAQHPGRRHSERSIGQSPSTESRHWKTRRCGRTASDSAQCDKP